MKLMVYTDGGARGNPGPAAIGVVIQSVQGAEDRVQENKEGLLIEFGKKIGETTNNVAEYTAVLEALKEIKQLSLKDLHIQFYLDSRLVVEQLNGRFKVKDMKLKELLLQVRISEQEVGGVITYTSVPREQNTRADFFVNKALDEIR